MSKKMPLATYYFIIYTYNECSSISLFYVSNSVDIMLIFWCKPPSLLVPIYTYVLPTNAVNRYYNHSDRKKLYSIH